MDEQLQAEFRRRLHALMSALKISRRNPKLQALIGTMGLSAVSDAKAQGWADLKQRLGAPGYDALLKAMQKSAADLKQKGVTDGPRALEVLAVSIIARRQHDPELEQPVRVLDDYVEACIATAKRIAASAGT
ncbi:MAG: hypothetical protein ABIO40_02960 [Devosia sp.]